MPFVITGIVLYDLTTIDPLAFEPIPILFILLGAITHVTFALSLISFMTSSQTILINLLFTLGAPQGLTPVSIPASGIRLIILPMVAIADKPGLWTTSQSNNSGGIDFNA